MYDGGKIITGLVIGVALLLFPVFYNAGKAAKAPEPELTAEATVAPADDGAPAEEAAAAST